MKCSCHSRYMMDRFVLGFFLVRKGVKPWKNQELDDTGCWPMSAVVLLKQFICKSKSCLVVEISVWVGPAVGFSRFSLKALWGKCICHVMLNWKTGNKFGTEMALTLWKENISSGQATTLKAVAAVLGICGRVEGPSFDSQAEFVLKDVSLRTCDQFQGAEGKWSKRHF